MIQQMFRREKKTNIWLFSLQIGFFAGLIWGAVRGLFYYMKFTGIVPGFLLEPFFKHAYLKSPPGYYVGWLSFILFSIVASLIYVVAFRKLKGPWPGLVYGVAWWLVLFFVLGPFTKMTRPATEHSFDTMFSEFCVFLLWGLFMGYTAAEEYTNERVREPNKVLH